MKNYIYDIQKENGAIVIYDLGVGGEKSVTNSIESILEDIEYDEGVDPREYHIVYRDSDYVFDGFDYKRGKFIRLNAKTVEEALYLMEV